MSLIVGIRYRDGVVLASDPFRFDNDAIYPKKASRFDRVSVLPRQGLAFAAVGSSWVQSEFHRWVTNKRGACTARLLDSLATKWAELSEFWKKEREEETAPGGTLRPISDSVLFLARTEDVTKIYAIDHRGKVSTTKTFVLAGSGSWLVHDGLRMKRTDFDPNQSLDTCLSHIRSWYDLASADLFVVGIPCIVLVTRATIVDLQEKCAMAWGSLMEKYFRELHLAAISQTLRSSDSVSIYAEQLYLERRAEPSDSGDISVVSTGRSACTGASFSRS